MSVRFSAIRAVAAASVLGAVLFCRCRSGAWRNARRLTARQPRNRFTRSQISPARCWISIAAGPSTRSTSVPASLSSPSVRRGHCSLIGSLWAAISWPTISSQRVTNSAEAKPCRAKASPTSLPRSSRNGLAAGREGLFIAGCSAIDRAMTTLTAKTRGKKSPASSPNEQRGKPGGPQAADLLAWYDRHRRALPGRARRRERTDPYRVWLSETMLQQTTDKAVAPYYARFLARWPDLKALAAASLDEILAAWAGLGYYARARNMHACARALVERYAGQFPASESALRELPGIGAYTAAAIAAIAFDQCTTPVDGNIERVIARLYALATPLPAGKAEIARHARALTPASRAGDFAQALMDLGATICTPKNPACALCLWKES